MNKKWMAFGLLDSNKKSFGDTPAVTSYTHLGRLCRGGGGPEDHT